MKILFLTEFFPTDNNLKFSGGVETRAFYLTKYWFKEDDLHVICRKSDNLKKITRIDNITIYPVGPNYKHIEFGIFSLLERFIFLCSAIWQGLKIDFDIIEGSNFTTYLPAYLLGKVKNKKKIAWIPDIFNNNWEKYFGLAGKIGQFIESLALQFNWSKIIALSQTTAQKLINKNIAKNKIAVVYVGVEQNNALITADKQKTILYVGRLVNYKRVKDLIMAFSSLIKRGYQYKLIIIGRGPEEQNLKNKVFEYGLNDKVQFLKGLSRLKLDSIVSKSQIFCLPSLVEGFGLVTIESAALKTPFVVADIAVNKEITHNGLGGLFFKRSNTEDLANKLEMLIKNVKLYKQKQKECLLLAKKYDWQETAQQTRSIYLKVKHE